MCPNKMFIPDDNSGLRHDLCHPRLPAGRQECLNLPVGRQVGPALAGLLKAGMTNLIIWTRVLDILHLKEGKRSH